jgi:hypothetical protein
MVLPLRTMCVDLIRGIYLSLFFLFFFPFFLTKCKNIAHKNCILFFIHIFLSGCAGKEVEVSVGGNKSIQRRHG